jgi:hypothetical protein
VLGDLDDSAVVSLADDAPLVIVVPDTDDSREQQRVYFTDDAVPDELRPRCECPEHYDGTAHDGACGAVGVYRATRDGRSFVLCGDCILSTDTDRRPV